jgi:hypothetical protein
VETKGPLAGPWDSSCGKRRITTQYQQEFELAYHNFVKSQVKLRKSRKPVQMAA